MKGKRLVLQSIGKDYRAYAAYVVVCLAWGSTYLAIRIGVADMPILLFGAMRFITAGLILMSLVAVTGQRLPSRRRDLRTIAITALMLLVASHFLILWAERSVPSGMTSLVLSATPLFVAVLDHLVPGGYKIGLRGWLGLIIGFSGVALLLSPVNTVQGLPVAGLFTLLGSSVFWAAGSIYSARRPIDASLLAVAALETLLAGLVMGTAGLLAGETAHFNLTYNAMYALALLVVVGSVMGYSAFVYVVGKMPPSIGMTYSYVNPVVAVILGALVLDETVAPGEIASFIVIMAGVLLTHSARFAGRNVEQNEEHNAIRNENRQAAGLYDDMLGIDGTHLVAAFALGQVEGAVSIVDQQAGILAAGRDCRGGAQADGDK